MGIEQEVPALREELKKMVPELERRIIPLQNLLELRLSGLRSSGLSDKDIIYKDTFASFLSQAVDSLRSTISHAKETQGMLDDGEDTLEVELRGVVDKPMR